MWVFFFCHFHFNPKKREKKKKLCPANLVFTHRALLQPHNSISVCCSNSVSVANEPLLQLPSSLTASPPHPPLILKRFQVWFPIRTQLKQYWEKHACIGQPVGVGKQKHSRNLNAPTKQFPRLHTWDRIELKICPTKPPIDVTLPIYLRNNSWKLILTYIT